MSIRHETSRGYRATRSDLRSTVAMGLVSGMVSGIRDRSPDLNGLLARCDIDARLLDFPTARVPLASYAKLYNQLVSTLDDEAFGLFSSPMRCGTFEFLCRCAVSSHTLGEALDRMSRFLRIVLVEFELVVIRRGAMAELVLRESVGRGWSPNEAQRVFAYEWLLRLVHGLACWLVGRSLPLSEVGFPYPEPAYASDYALIYTSNPTFVEGNALIAMLTGNLLELPVRREEADIGSFLIGAPGKITTLYRRDRLVVRQVRDLLASALPTSIQLDYVADKLNLSPRTLHRKLQEEGSSFRVIKDALRRDLALARAEKSDEAFAEIASNLGYSDFSAFFRAFKSWTGLAPSDYRAIKNRHAK